MSAPPVWFASTLEALLERRDLDPASMTRLMEDLLG